jgi:hypothetical protein
MTIRREADVLVRDPFDPNAPGDYLASEAAARAVVDALAGDKDKLFDPRYPGVLGNYVLVSHRQAADGAVAILRHKTLDHCMTLSVHAAPLGSYRGADHDIADLTATLSRPTIQYEPQDRGALENYTLESRREEGGLTHLVLRHFRSGNQVDVSLGVVPVAPRRAYEHALDQDDLWRKAGHTVYDERHPRPR